MKLELVDVAPLRFEGGPAESGEYLLSPYVFAQGARDRDTGGAADRR